MRGYQPIESSRRSPPPRGRSQRNVEMHDYDSYVDPPNNAHHSNSLSPDTLNVLVTRPPFLYSEASPGRSGWGRIIDLDEFFTRVYDYHKRKGFWCSVLEDALELARFTFVAIFVGFLITCVDYEVLFKDKLIKRAATFNDTTYKVTLSDAIDFDPAKLSFFVVLCGLVAIAFWVYWFLVLMWKVSRTSSMCRFYHQMLNVDDTCLESLKWSEVLEKLREAQAKYQFCVHKSVLNHADVYHHILRRKNYLVALVNKHMLPVKFEVPVLGEVSFFTNGFKFNFEFLFFLGWYSPWKDYWRLKDEYKDPDFIDVLTRKTERIVFWLALLNFVLSPVVFVWQIFYSLFSYGELVKREPGILGARRWSIYGKYFCRHFNELDHELEYRLSLAYKPASQYLDMFRSNMAEIVARNLIFFLGAPVIVLLALSVYDEDVLQVRHVLSIITAFGLVVAVCKSFLNNENQVWCPELMMKVLAAHLHYVPDHWRGQAHTTSVRHEASQLFQYTASFVLEELLSPVVTPFVLMFWLRPRTRQVLEFIRKFTIEVPSLGDVCSFAMLDVKKHGDRTWHPQNVQGTAEDDESVFSGVHEEQGAEMGKTEMSLLHFKLTNPDWKPPPSSDRFLTSVRQRCREDAAATNFAQQPDFLQNPLLQSLVSLPMPCYQGLAVSSSDHGFVLSTLRQHGFSVDELLRSGRHQQQQVQNFSVHQSNMLISNLMLNTAAVGANFSAPLELTAEAEMSLTTAYLRNIREQRMKPKIRDYGSTHGCMNDQVPSSSSGGGGGQSGLQRDQQQQDLLGGGDLLWRVPLGELASLRLESPPPSNQHPPIQGARSDHSDSEEEAPPTHFDVLQ